MATVIQKTKIEVDFSDLNKLDVKLNSSGKAAEDFGDSVSRTSKSTESFGRSIGDISEKLDKKLDKGLGRAFKATDRLNSILGQFAAVGAIATAAIGVLAGAYAALRDSSAKADAELANVTAGLISQAKAAELAKNAVADLGKVSVRTFSQIVATAQAQARVSAAQAVLVVATEKTINAESKLAKERERQARKSASDHSGANTIIIDNETARGRKIEKIEEEIAKARALGVKAQQAVADAVGTLSRAEDEGVFERLPQFLRTALVEAESFADGLRGDVGGAIGDVAAAGDAWLKSWQKNTRAAASATKEMTEAEAKAIGEAAAAQLRSLIALQEITGPIVAQQEADRLLVIADAAAEEARSLNALADIVARITKEQTAAAKSSAEWASAIDETGKALSRSADDALNAALTTAIYGGSFKDATNDILEALTIEAGVQGLKQLALGFGAAAIGSPTAPGHFKSAAVWGAVGVAGAIGTAATGGFNGPTEEDEEDDSAAFTGAGDTGPDRSGGGGGQTVTNVNLNLFAAPGTRIDRARDGQALRSLLRDAGLPGA
ncbi:MAG: hypothetical protein COA38_20610 [Fluviicola sp.]|nr:MAG: hypothetical protein COA38_20610 [Fluviicola sp.]